MQKGSLLRLLMDEMTEGQVDWAPLNNTYDVVALGHPESAKLVPIRKGRREQMEEIIKHFPNERAGIEKFYGQLRGQGFSLGMGVLKLFPLRFSLFLIKLGWFLKIFPVFKKVKLTLQQYLDELTDNADLKAVLSYAFGDYGKECVRVHEECVRVHEECVRVHEECVRVHEECVRVHEECVRVHEECVRVHEECVRVHEECVRVHEECVRVHEECKRHNSSIDSFIRCSAQRCSIDDAQFIGRSFCKKWRVLPNWWEQ